MLIGPVEKEKKGNSRAKTQKAKGPEAGPPDFGHEADAIRAHRRLQAEHFHGSRGDVLGSRLHEDHQTITAWDLPVDRFRNGGSQALGVADNDPYRNCSRL